MEIDRSLLSPMMAKYMETKDAHPGCILFYRLGDFYEMFFRDAEIVSRELELTLTGKSCGLPERAPMCGVPYHAADTYLSRLIQKGYKVAICEQVEDPRLAKGLVKREVIRIVTPGTNLDPMAMDETRNNFLMCSVYVDEKYGIATCDVSTGDFFVTEVEDEKRMLDEMNKFQPVELIVNDAFAISGIDTAELSERMHVAVSTLTPDYFADDLCIRTIEEHFHVTTLAGLGLTEYPCGCVAAGAVLRYLLETQKTKLSQIATVHPYRTGGFLLIDSSSRRNLELTETMREKQKRGSLLWVLDKTKTAMGARRLRSMIEQPLIEPEKIRKRQDAIEELNQNIITRDELQEYLNPIYDLERLLARIVYQTANARDLIAFQSSIRMLPAIKTLLSDFHAELLCEIAGEMDALTDLFQLIEESIAEDPPITLHDGGLLKEGYHEEVDRLRKAKTEGKQWLAELEQKEREATGIKNLRIRYNKVFGYYIEVTNSFLSKVPDTYMRKQTLTNAERFITPELKEMEDTILGAEDRLIALEYEIFSGIRLALAEEVIRIQKTAKAVAELDVFASLSLVSEQNRYCRPRINTEGRITIRAGRHPVVEKMIPHDLFIPNDTELDSDRNRISIITGPNMAGKSTYMRQTALIVLMAQVGSFVPADDADIGIVDRIFTRVGASDDLSSGQSTFMVEMTEVANILRNATADSLLILDEIGRGTSTFDGLSIAWAVVEHISNPKLLGAKTLFATHYHELTELEGKLPGVNNYCIAVKEKGDDIVFLRKIVPGGADKSYGIQVAHLAGVPTSVTDRAKEIVSELIQNDIAKVAAGIDVKGGPPEAKEPEMVQLSLFDPPGEDAVLAELRDLPVEEMTPIEALNKLFELKGRLQALD